jgi:exodeoxyribonuclease-3
MDITIATWNINSVRLRTPLVEQFTRAHRPDVLCLQETKCPDGQFPTAAIRKMGYEHIAFNGQSGYHGVAILSRLPLVDIEKRGFCDKGDARHIAATVDTGGKLRPRLHNFYVPAGGDEPDPLVNAKFAHKLRFLREMEAWFGGEHDDHLVLVGDLNIAPLEHDVWSHKQLLKVVSHTPIEVEHLGRVRASRDWIDLMRRDVPADEKIYTWWSYRARDWAAVDKGRRLDHIWLSPALAGSATAVSVVRDARGWERPSDHAPVIATLSL